MTFYWRSLLLLNFILVETLCMLNDILLEVFTPAEFYFGRDFMHAK